MADDGSSYCNRAEIAARQADRDADSASWSAKDAKSSAYKAESSADRANKSAGDIDSLKKEIITELSVLSYNLNSFSLLLKRSTFAMEWERAVRELCQKHGNNPKFVPDEEIILKRIANNRMNEVKFMEQVETYVKKGL